MFITNCSTWKLSSQINFISERLDKSGEEGGGGWITRAGFYDVWTMKKDKESKSLEVSGENDKEGQNKINYRAFYFSEASYRF